MLAAPDPVPEDGSGVAMQAELLAVCWRMLTYMLTYADVMRRRHAGRAPCRMLAYACRMLAYADVYADVR
jgi:hypothetical protein